VKKPGDMPLKMRRQVLTVLALVLVPLMAMADFETPDIVRIAQATAIDPPGSVRFREERHNPMFSEPLVLTGSLEYLGPGVIRKNIESPFQESYLIEPGQVTVVKNNREEVLPTRQGKMISAMLGGIEALLAGDHDSIEEAFEIDLSGTMASWTLDLTPRSKRLRKYINSIEIAGNEISFQTLRIDLDDEEWHLMQIIHPQPLAEK